HWGRSQCRQSLRYRMSGHTSAESKARARKSRRRAMPVTKCSTSRRSSNNHHRRGEKTNLSPTTSAERANSARARRRAIRGPPNRLQIFRSHEKTFSHYGALSLPQDAGARADLARQPGDQHGSYECSLRWKAIAPGRVHILTASPHLDTSTAASRSKYAVNRMRKGLVDESAGRFDSCRPLEEDMHWA